MAPRFGEVTGVFGLCGGNGGCGGDSDTAAALEEDRLGREEEEEL